MPHELTRGVLDPLALGPLLTGVGLLLGQLGLALDVDAPAREAGGQAGVLALLPDCQRELVVGHDHLGRTGLLVDAHLFDLGRREGLHHELRRLLGEGDDVDLLTAQLVDDHADTRPPGADARTDGIDVGVVRPHRDLGAVARLPGHSLELHHAVADLRHLQLEEALDQARVGAADDDLGALGGLAHLDDVGLEAGVAVVVLVGHLLGLGQQGLHPAQVEEGVALVLLLDDPGDDVALAPGVLLVLDVALRLADALEDDLLGRLGGDAPEVLGRVLPLTDDVAVLVELLGVDVHLPAVGVDGDDRFLRRVGHALVGRDQGVGESVEEGVHGDALLALEDLQGLHQLEVRGHQWAFALCLALPRSAGSHTKTVRAFSMSS